MAGYKRQLCWSCDRATGGCPWSSKGKPIKGWEATPTVVSDRTLEIRSFEIRKCPLYIKEKR